MWRHCDGEDHARFWRVVWDVERDAGAADEDRLDVLQEYVKMFMAPWHGCLAWSQEHLQALGNNCDDEYMYA